MVPGDVPKLLRGKYVHNIVAGKILLLKIISRRLSEYTVSAWASCRRNRVVTDRTVIPPIWFLRFVGYRS